MPFTKEQIDIWRSLPSETQVIEFKEAKNNYDTRKLCEYCVALANEGGGQFVLGIVDAPPRPVVGSNAFLNVIKAAENLFEWLGFRVDVEEVDHPEASNTGNARLRSLGGCSARDRKTPSHTRRRDRR